ncbi:MAG: hypothetical protein Q7J29_13490 [Stagnimonas sp.]|nr:hypothetical protein [Stagnimonas sp.]
MRISALALAAFLAVPLAAMALPIFGKPKLEDRRGGDSFLPRSQAQEAPSDNGQGVPGLSANEAARQAQSLNGGGRVLSVEQANGGWRVKLLKDGNVRFVFVQQ